MGTENKRNMLADFSLDNWVPELQGHLEREIQRKFVEEAEKILSSPEAVAKQITSGKMPGYVAKIIGRAAVTKQLRQMKYDIGQYGRCKKQKCRITDTW